MTDRFKIWLTPDLLEENKSLNLFRCFAASHPVGAVTFLVTRFDHTTPLEDLSARCAEALQRSLQTSSAFADFSLYLFASVRVLLESPRVNYQMRQHGPRPALHYLGVSEQAVEIEIPDPIDRRFAAIVPVEQEQLVASLEGCRRDELRFMFLASRSLAISRERVLECLNPTGRV